MQVCTFFQTDNRASAPPLSFSTGWMPFLSPNQQRQSTKGSLSYTNEIVMAFIRNVCWAFAPFLDTCFQTSPPQTSARHTYPDANQGVVSAITVFKGGHRWGGQMSDHTWCLGICVCGEKISCPPRQINGRYIEGYCPGQ